jgi:hypothetical protein
MTKTSESAIFAGILRNSEADMKRELAQYVLTLGFDEKQQAHMQELATRNQEGGLSSVEHEELMNYVRAGHLLALLHSQARRVLKKRKGKRSAISRQLSAMAGSAIVIAFQDGVEIFVFWLKADS